MKKENIQGRLDKIEAIIDSFQVIQKHTPEERAHLREIAVRVAERIRQENIKPGDKEALKTIITEESQKTGKIETVTKCESAP